MSHDVMHVGTVCKSINKDAMAGACQVSSRYHSFSFVHPPGSVMVVMGYIHTKVGIDLFDSGFSVAPSDASVERKRKL